MWQILGGNEQNRGKGEERRGKGGKKGKGEKER